MSKKNLFIIAIMIMVFMPVVYSATIHGTVYDALLNKRINSIVEIDTSPVQRYVVKYGTYSFNVPDGDYTVTATYNIGDITYSRDSVAVEVAGEGEYVVDLILFPVTDEEDEILEEANQDLIVGLQEEPSIWYILIYAIVFIIIGYVIYKYTKKKEDVKEKVMEDGAQAMIKFIKKQGGRTTQKEIRKNFPQSEAKISLIVADLEDQGKIRKIKKGRGNIIILKSS